MRFFVCRKFGRKTRYLSSLPKRIDRARNVVGYFRAKKVIDNLPENIYQRIFSAERSISVVEGVSDY